MTDKKTDTSQDERARAQTPVLTTPASKRVPPQDGGAKNASRSQSAGRSVLAPAALVIALLGLGLSAVVWQQNKQSQALYAELEPRLSAMQSTGSRTASELEQLLARLEQQDGRIDALQGQLAEASAVIQDLDEALRIMTDRGSELVLLNDVDHLVTIAQQQLQLGGNVRNAIVALESAQSQLARANRPSLAMLQQTLNGDLDRLRAASTVDIAAFSHQLEELAVLVTEAPLIMPDRAATSSEEAATPPVREHPAPTVPPETGANDNWLDKAWDTTRNWSRSAWSSLREDLGQFIEVRRVDDASALLMSPDQASRFRDNLRTRIMTAQLALMMRQPEVWKTETAAVVKALETRYDDASPLTRKAIRMARAMADTEIDARLPTVDNSLQALTTLREEQTRNFGATDAGAEAGSGAAANSEAPAVPEGPSAGDHTGSQEPGSESGSEPASESGSANPSSPAEQADERLGS